MDISKDEPTPFPTRRKLRTSQSLFVNIVWLKTILITICIHVCQSRPLVRHIHSVHEFDRLMDKHATSTGLPVIVDFYSDGCGPCRQMAPIFKKLAAEVDGKAVFAKVDTNALYELSGRYGVRSIPTFIFFLNGKKVNEFSGAGEGQLRQFTTSIMDKADRENAKLTLESLTEFYKKVAPDTEAKKIEEVYKKCSDLIKDKNPDKQCIGSAATQLKRKLKGKYKEGPELEKRFLEEDQKAKGKEDEPKSKTSSTNDSSKSNSNKANLHLASLEDLQKELESRMDDEIESQLETEDDDEDEFLHSYTPSEFPERVVIIGGGPAGIAAAIYTARAGLKPVVVAPPMGGQLQGKGVDVENYPGMINVTGPAVVSVMRNQAAEFGTVFEAETVLRIDVSERPIKVITNSSVITTHAIIVATGAESNWLNVEGEWEMRGGGVSSCATCDGAAFYNKHVLVVGGGDTAMEDALVLARTSKKVSLIHRRDTFRASKILATRVIEHPAIEIVWNTTVEKILGETVEEEREETDNDEMDLDVAEKKIVTGAILKDITTGQTRKLDCDGVFVAIGHTPTTSFLKGIVDFDPLKPGYVLTQTGSTKTSFDGIFAAGDVADAVYRQAITSAGSGAAAALDAERWLSEEGLGNEEMEFEMELMRELMGDGDDGITASSGGYNVYEDVVVKGMKESVGIATEL